MTIYRRKDSIFLPISATFQKKYLFSIMFLFVIKQSYFITVLFFYKSNQINKVGASNITNQINKDHKFKGNHFVYGKNYLIL